MIKIKSSEILKLMFCVLVLSAPCFSNMSLDYDMRLRYSYYFWNSLTWRQKAASWFQGFQNSLESFKSQSEFADMFAVHIFFSFLRTAASLSLQYQVSDYKSRC